MLNVESTLKTYELHKMEYFGWEYWF